MRKASIWEKPVSIILIIVIAALLIFLIYMWLGKWGASHASSIADAIDITKYV